VPIDTWSTPMLSLRELQRAFVDGALYEQATPICTCIKRNGIAAERRLAIYRNNAVEGFLQTLQATFPVLVRLSGEGWFRQRGRAYMRQHPSRSGNIHYIGERFPAFLDAVLAGSEYDYFADVARLEWAYQEALVAAEHPGFDLASLSTVPPERYAALTFQTHPAMRLVRSRFPILSIWKANQPGSTGGGQITLDDGPSNVLVMRRDDHVELRELAASDFELLASFARGESFELAAEYALQAAPEADLGAALARVAQLGTLVDFTLPSNL
jgi:hypothetical protein